MKNPQKVRGDPRRIIKKFRRALYQIARRTRDVEVLASGDPEKIVRRVKNIILGRVIARGAWKIWQ